MAGDAELQAGRGRMLVFACDVASAKSTAGVLEEAGVPVLQVRPAGVHVLPAADAGAGA